MLPKCLCLVPSVPSYVWCAIQHACPPEDTNRACDLCWVLRCISKQVPMAADDDSALYADASGTAPTHGKTVYQLAAGSKVTKRGNALYDEAGTQVAVHDEILRNYMCPDGSRLVCFPPPPEPSCVTLVACVFAAPPLLTMGPSCVAHVARTKL